MKSLRTIILLGLFSLSLTSLIAQNNYLEYYNLINQANQSSYEKAYKKSLALYQQGFAKVDYVHAPNYAKAARVAARQKKYDLSKEYIVKAIQCGYPLNFIKGKAFKGFRKSKAYKSLEKEIALHQQTHQAAINQSYQRIIDSLHFIDQNRLRGNHRVKGFDLDTTLTYSDSLNFQCLLEHIEEYGFPSEQRIGFGGYRKAWVIIHHNARLLQNHYYWPTLLAYLKKGEYQPENYCWVVDQGTELKGEALVYYHWDVAQNIDQLSAEEKKAIDQRRKAVGMPSIERIKVEKKLDSFRNRVRW